MTSTDPGGGAGRRARAGRLPLGSVGWSAALALGAAVGLLAQPPAATHTERVDVTVATIAVHLPGASAGSPPGPAAIEVHEDGAPRRVLSVRRWLAPGEAERVGSAATAAGPAAAGGPPLAVAAEELAPEFTLYLDLDMTGYSVLRTVVRQMGATLAELARSGPVTVAVANPEPTLRLEATRDPAAVRGLLEELVREVPPRGAIEAHRGALVHDSEWAPLGNGLLLAFATEEGQRIAAARLRLLRWLASRPGADGPRVLYLVGGSFDSDPSGFYARFSPPDRGGAPSAVLARDLGALAQNEEDEELARLLAGWGWLAFPIAPVDVGFSDFGGAREGGHRRWLAFAQGADAPGQVTPFLFVDPGGGWRPLAERSGGQLIRTAKNLAAARQRLDETLLVSYERPGAARGRRFALEVRRAGDGSRLAAPAWIEEGTPETINIARAVQAGADPEARGGLAVAVRILSRAPAPGGGQRVRLELDCRSTTPGIEPGGALLVAIVVFGSDAVLERPAAATTATPGRFTAEARLPAGAEALGIAVEDPDSGLWGNARVALSEGG